MGRNKELFGVRWQRSRATPLWIRPLELSGQSAVAAAVYWRTSNKRDRAVSTK